jgi:hypothetical protein
MGTISRAFTTKKVKMSLELAQEAKLRAAAAKEAKEKQADKERAAAAIQRTDTTKPTPISTKPSSLTKPPPPNVYTRAKISGPIELIHTTNMLSYNAPDLPRPSTSSQGSTKSSMHTDDDSDSSPGTAASSPPTSPDVASSELKRSSSPEPNHLSSYFIPDTATQTATAPAPAPPAIPQRAPTHTKQASIDAIARQRSNSTRLLRESLSSSQRYNSSVTRSPSTATAASARSQESAKTHITTPSITSVQGPAPPVSPPRKSQLGSNQHPFGSELAQVTEIAEEFGVREKLAAADEEELELTSRGLCKISADVYLRDIEDLWSLFFAEQKMMPMQPAPPTWI